MIHTDVFCDKCKKQTNQSQITEYKLNHDTRFIIIRINLSTTENNINVRHEMKITDFNPDNIKIPGIAKRFVLKSAIIHEPMMDPKHLTAGHYKCLVRNETSWFAISDNIGNRLNNFNENLKDVFVLLLELV
jgi:hypothetical protein